MKIIKVTMLNHRTLSWEFNEYKPSNILKDAYEEFISQRVYHTKASDLMASLQVVPDKIEELIGIHFPEYHWDKKKTGKNKWQYSIAGGLYIHVEE